MDGAERTGRKANRGLDTIVRQLAAAAEVIKASLHRAVHGSDTTLGVAARSCAANWGVEGGSIEATVRSAALLLVLRKVVQVYAGHRHGNWARLREVESGVALLATVAELAESEACIAAALTGVSKCLPDDLKTLVDAAANEADATLPLSLVYEPLLARFDRRERTARGVYHTPKPLVGWMVGGVRWLLETEFPETGSVRLIDMGTGCGSFLAELQVAFGGLRTSEGLNASLLGYEVLPTAIAMCRWLLELQGGGVGPPVELAWTNPLLRGEEERHAIRRGDAMPIILGNPPYANYGRANRGSWIDRLLREYKRELGERKANLDDDFIKFIRWGQYWIDQAGQGILAVVTSNTYLSGLTHRRMRESLLESFDRVYLLDLHGGASPSVAIADIDENVFPIRSGVAVALFSKSLRPRDSKVYHSELVGTRASKLSRLRETPAALTDWQRIEPAGPDFTCRPHPPGRAQRRYEYEEFWPLTRIFRQWVSGVQTKNDRLFVDLDRTRLAKRIEAWLGDLSRTSEPSSQVVGFDERLVQPYLVAPFDRRWIYYDRRLLGRARYEVMRHMLQPNLGLAFMRQSTNSGEYNHFLAVDCLVSDRVFHSRHGAPYLAPLWLHSSELIPSGKEHNFTPEWLEAVAAKISTEPGAEMVFDYLYAAAWRTDYRERFSAELLRNFPRIPLPESADQFSALADIGRRLRTVHTGREPISAAECDGTTWIGGYEVLKRWRKPRMARNKIGTEFVEEEKRLKQILGETQHLRKQLDALP